MSLAHDLDQLAHELPDTWTAATVRVVLERNDAVAPEHRDRAAEVLRAVGATFHEAGFRATITPGTTALLYGALKALEDARYWGQVSVVSVSGPVSDLARWRHDTRPHQITADPAGAGTLVLA